MERSAITKFGIAGELYGNAYKRLRDYQIEYGDATKKNDCKGTWIYYCGITKYNPYVLPANTEVRKTETYLKRLFKSKLEKKTWNRKSESFTSKSHRSYTEYPIQRCRERWSSKARTVSRARILLTLNPRKKGFTRIPPTLAGPRGARDDGGPRARGPLDVAAGLTPAIKHTHTKKEKNER